MSKGICPVCNGDWEFLCYNLGLPYGHFNKEMSHGYMP